MELFKDFLFNTALLVSMSMLGQFFYFQSRRLFIRIIHGIILGAIGIVLMMNTVELSDGIIFDTRSILVSVSGLFYGTLPTAIAVVIISIYRIILGGSGVLAGVLVTVVTAAVGVIWGKVRFRKLFLKKHRWLEYYIFGFVTHILMLLCMFALPDNMAIPTIRTIAIPVLLVYPLGVALICFMVMYWREFSGTKDLLKESESRFRTLFENAPIGISIANKNSIVFINSKFEDMIGRPKDELYKMGWKKFTHPDDIDEDEKNYQKLLSGEISSYEMTKRYVRPDSSEVWAFLIVAKVKSDTPEEGYHICMALDITDKLKYEQDLKKSEEQYRNLYVEYLNKERLMIALLDSIPDIIFFKDTDSVYMGSNKAYREFIQRTEEEIVGKTDFDFFDKKTAEFYRTMDKAMLESQTPRINEEEAAYPDGRVGIFETMKTPYYDEQGNNLGLIGISRDVTERKKKEEEIMYLSTHDSLTGLKSRIFFEKELARLEYHELYPFSIIVGDINSMKLINNIYGHEQGDLLIKETAQVLKKCCRPEDTIARTGGDEFTIIMPNTDETEARKVFHSIIDTFETYPFTNKADQLRGVSVGLVTKTDASQDTVLLLKEAEEHMYKRKLLSDRSVHGSLLTMIKTTVFERSHETEEHAERMVDLAHKVGVEIGLSDDELVDLELATTMHDLGKMGIDPAILTKKAKLTDEEWDMLRQHPEIGYKIAQTIPELYGVSQYILYHHERWDGKGYPHGLIGEQIPLISRIISVVDAYDAMTEDRPYRNALPVELAIAEIKKNAGSQFDRTIAELFIKNI